ncbi:MAG: ATP-binding cassette domain-containing protein, partial [Planctomycetaceae bacterium]|nr:ATP-binding cassette domain-containing protein [Planctomycetaceae bacterium]
MGKQFIFQMENLTKKIGQRQILENVWLAFYPGAKIGVLGRNGSGKSTLLRIMAGYDREFDGVARLSPGFTSGYLPQEPQLDPNLDVWGNLQSAVAPRRAIVDRYTELVAKCSEPLSEQQMQKVYDEMARVQDQIEAQNLWELDREIEIA